MTVINALERSDWPPKGGARPLLLVMGVSGSGKTTLSEALAQALGGPFLDADALHPQANIAKMRHGVPLDDADRAPWLDAVASKLDAFARAGHGGVAACSALKREYRRRILARTPEAGLIFIAVSKALARQRMAGRGDHFMPPSLADSQFQALEEPSPDERAFVVQGESDVDQMVRRILEYLKASPAKPLL